MTEQLRIRDELLESAGTTMLIASRCMSEDNWAMPSTPLSSLTGVGGDVQEFLRGIQTGRLALGDAAKTACGELANLMNESSAFDSFAAAALSSGFAVPGGQR